MNIIRKYNTGDPYVTLTVKCPPLPDKVITVYLDALVAGKTTIEEQIQKAEADAQKRLQAHLLAESIIK